MTINHITYNTGNNVKFSANDIDKRILFKMKNFINEAKKNGFSELFDGVKFKLTQEHGMYIASLYYMKFPFLMSYGSRNKSDYLWELVTDAGKKFLPQNPIMIQPQAPYVIDLIVPFPVPLEIYSWTGDFTRCLFWYLLMNYNEKGI